MTAEVTMLGVLDMQVYVPIKWTDDQVRGFAEKENPCGTSNGWFIRRQGDRLLDGDDERVKCEDRADHVHIVLDA